MKEIKIRLSDDQIVQLIATMHIYGGMTSDEVSAELAGEDCPLTYELGEVKAWLLRVKEKYSRNIPA